MAKLVYDETGRLLFTKEMKEEYTLLMPQMLPVHFGMMQKLLECEGYKVDMLTSNHRGIIDEGLKYVHNDTCYPALLVIGQLIDAITTDEMRSILEDGDKLYTQLKIDDISNLGAVKIRIRSLMAAIEARKQS